MTFFFDNHLPPRFPQILKGRGVDAIHLREKFPKGIDDVVWIAEAGRQEWVVITADHKIRSRKAERIALKEAHIIVFFCDKNLPHKLCHTQIEWLEKRWAAIEKHADGAEPDDMYEVPWSGPVKKILTTL